MGELAADELDRDPLVEPEVPRGHDGAHRALADPALDRVPPGESSANVVSDGSALGPERARCQSHYR
jgi:hypothetical protein